jgi:hypothetical protein
VQRVFGIGLLVVSAPLVLGGCAALSTSQVADSPPAPVLEQAPVDPANALLQRIGTLPTGQPVSVDGEVWLPGRLYSAASGRQCRLVDVEGLGGGSETRLACLAADGDGAAWDWFPVVAP